MSTTRYRLGGIALIAGPLLILAANVFHPGVAQNGKEMFALVSENSGQWLLVTFLGFFGFMLLVPAAIAGARFIRATHPRGSLVATIGIGVSSITIAGFHTFDLAFAGMTEGDPVEMAALYDRTQDVSAFAILIGLAVLTVLVGIPVLAWGLWRSRAVHRAVPVLILAGFAAGFVLEDVNALNIAGDALFAAGLAWLGWHALTKGQPDTANVRDIPPPRAAAA